MLFWLYCIIVYVLVLKPTSSTSGPNPQSKTNHSKTHSAYYNYTNYSCIQSDQLGYAENGQLSVADSLANCIRNVNSADIFPGYVTFQPLNIQANIGLVNLVAVDEIQSTYTVTFFFRLQWIDPRFSMPAFWETYNNSFYNSNGINIYPILGKSVDGTNVDFWRPDVYFPDTIEYDEIENQIKIYPSGKFLWSRMIKGTFFARKEDLNSKNYPKDKIAITMRYESYSFLLNSVTLSFLSPPLQLYKSNNGDIIIKSNPIWNYDSDISYIQVCTYSTYRLYKRF